MCLLWERSESNNLFREILLNVMPSDFKYFYFNKLRIILMKIEYLQPKRILLDGKTVEYYDEGKGYPVLLIHGWLFSKVILRILIKELLKRRGGFRVIAPDLPGFGNSEELNDVHSPENYAKFLDRFVSKLKLKKFYLFGSSGGGTIVLDYTINHPKKVEKLIVHAPFFYGGQTWKYSIKLRILVKLIQHSKILREILYRKVVSENIKSKEHFLKIIPEKYHLEFEKIARESEYFLKKTVSKRAAEELGRYATR